MSLLDNMIWNAISTGNKSIATLRGKVGVFLPDVAPFAAMEELDKENLDDLFEFLEPGRKVAISYLDQINLDPAKWQTLMHMDCCQMLYTQPVKSYLTDQSSQIVPLKREHVPQMLELTALTRPGPFLKDTILFGNYFGIFENGRLAAMTGQRMNPIPYMEISAVCTHPDFRGKGYARTLMLHVMQIITENSFIPFLHVLSNNTGAIQLYESIGFRVRRNLWIDLVVKV